MGEPVCSVPSARALEGPVGDAARGRWGNWALGSRKDSSSTVPRWDGVEARLQGLLLWTWLEPLKAAAGLLSGVAGRRLRAARGSRAGSEGWGCRAAWARVLPWSSMPAPGVGIRTK